MGFGLPMGCPKIVLDHVCVCMCKLFVCLSTQKYVNLRHTSKLQLEYKLQLVPVLTHEYCNMKIKYQMLHVILI